MQLSVRDLTRVVKGQLILGDPRMMASSVCVDTRTLREGAVFFAFRGDHVDGHDYATLACKRGAAAVVVSHVNWLQAGTGLSTGVIQVSDVPEALRLLAQYFRNGFHGPVIGVTGSNGKTTTKQMVASVMNTQSPGLFTTGNFNSQIGLPLVLSDLKPEHKWMVLEMGASAPGHISLLSDMARPSIGIISSIGPAHLATFGSVKRIAESKWELMDSLPSDGCAIVPWGVEPLEPLIRSYKKRIIFFGENSSCPVRASAVETGEKMSFLLHIGSQNIRVRLPVSGRCNVSNALAAAAVGWYLNIPIEKIAAGLEQFEPPKMRNETVIHSSGAVLVNDAYNANPASVNQAVRSIVETYPGRHFTFVLGSMLELGEESEKYHFHLGTELAKFQVDHVILTGEETKHVLEGALSSGASKEKFLWQDSKEEISKLLKSKLMPGQVIFFKGSRGMELEKIIKELVN